MRTSLNASLPWMRPPGRDGAPQGAAQQPGSAAKSAARPAANPAGKTPEAKLAKKAADEVAKQPVNRNPSPAEIRRMLCEAADRHGIPREILMAIAFKESSWRHYGRDGAVLRGRWSPTDQGIMQINEKAHPQAFPRARTDMRYNIEYGAQYLKYQYTRYGNWDEAVAAYNAGSVRRRKDKQIVNQPYVDKVMTFRAHFERRPEALPADG